MRPLFTILFYLLAAAAAAQNGVGLRLLRTYPGAVADAALDHLGNLYLVSETGQVRKFGPDGDSISVFNSVRRNGKLDALDVSNPLRPLLFYKDFGQVLLLDRFLAVQSTLDLRKAGIQQPLAAALSYDNRVWVFDGVDNKLRKLDEAGNLLSETPDLRQVFPGGVQPRQIIDHNNWVYLYDPAQGLFAFDYYGSFKRKVPVAGWDHLQVTDAAVLGFSNNELHTYNLATLMQTAQPLPSLLAGCGNISMGNQRWVAACTEGVRVYGPLP